ncbi:MarR family winged helix-turn-helix transcriptional regulator [Streptomyces sp. NPDC060209]|uniref:MarR family winged helix-turn-helix transcriptional regulator n=1 Tax=Streptomyces sp. NPDC060209 TaxID=3347073 RepID=UPI003660FAD6
MQQQSSPGTAHDPRTAGMTPPSVLNLNAYLMYATGKAARRRLTDTLTAHGLRLWHLTILAMLDDAGPLSKGDLASRLDMNQSDLTRTVTDLDAAGYVECARDPSDRRRIEVALTPAGRCALAGLNTDVSATEADLLAPLTHDGARPVHRPAAPCPRAPRTGPGRRRPRRHRRRTGRAEEGWRA